MFLVCLTGKDVTDGDEAKPAKPAPARPSSQAPTAVVKVEPAKGGPLVISDQFSAEWDALRVVCTFLEG